jgi:hypothetical protein
MLQQCSEEGGVIPNGPKIFRNPVYRFLFSPSNPSGKVRRSGVNTRFEWAVGIN